MPNKYYFFISKNSKVPHENYISDIVIKKN